MAKDLLTSSGLRGAILDTGSARAQLNNGRLRFFTGTIPATADASIGAATALVELTTDGNTLVSAGTNGLTLTLTSGALSITSGESWQGTPSNAGAADVTFWRWEKYGDDGSTTSTSLIRLQGTAGVAADPGDLILDSLAITHAVLFTLPSFILRLPRFRSEL